MYWDYIDFLTGFTGLISVSSVSVGIALGSNLGDRWAQLHEGFEFLATLAVSRVVKKSSLYETAPVDCPPDSGAFLNAVAEIEYAGTARELLGQLQAYELAQGRAKVREVNAPRTLDLDILYFGKQVIDEPDLAVPHQRLSQRRFVLEPLAEIRPELVLPGQTQTVLELWENLEK